MEENNNETNNVTPELKEENTNKMQNTETLGSTNSEVSNTLKEEISSNTNTTANDNNSSKKNTNASIDFKKEASEAKNFFTNFFKTPFEEFKKIVNKPKDFLKISIIVFVVWIIAEVIQSIIGIVDSYHYSPHYPFASFIRDSFESLFSIIGAILLPAISVALLAVIIYLAIKDKKKSYLTILTSVIIAKIPVILASIVSILGFINTNVSRITSSFSGLCSVVSTILVYFAIKALYGEEDDNKVARTFLIVMAIFYVIALVLKFFNVYI